MDARKRDIAAQLVFYARQLSELPESGEAVVVGGSGVYVEASQVSISGYRSSPVIDALMSFSKLNVGTPYGVVTHYFPNLTEMISIYRSGARTLCYVKEPHDPEVVAFLNKHNAGDPENAIEIIKYENSAP